MSVDEVGEVIAPFPHDQGTGSIYRIAMVFLVGKIVNSLGTRSRTNQGLLPGILRNRKDVRSARFQDAGNLPKSATRVEDVFENILGHDKIEGSISKCQLLEVFATESPLVCA